MFGLDDVRDSYAADMVRFLDAVEAGARGVAAAAEGAAPAGRSWEAPADAMVVGLHGIVGSSSLIALDSMAGTARRLEDLATLAGESIRELRHHAERLQQIASVCLAGSGDLRGILQAELAGDRGRADARRRDAHARIATAAEAIGRPVNGHAAGAPGPGAGVKIVPALPPVPPVPVPRAAPVVAVAADAALDPELVAVFEAEARETLTALRGHLARLGAAPGDREAAGQAARLLHLLKGAAATVGHDAAAEQARALNARIEGANGRGLDAAAVAEVARGVEALVAAVAPGLAASAPAPALAAGSVDDTQDAEARALFDEEARAALEEARELAAEVAARTGAARGVAASRVERILHRLKGSALIVGVAEVAAVAARGQAVCEALEQIELAALDGVLGELAALTGGPPAAAAPGVAPAPPAAARTVAFQVPPAEEWDVYVEEATDLLEQLDRLAGRLPGSASPTAELAQVLRVYHTLKGASSAIGLVPIGQQLHLIETHVQRLADEGVSGELREIAGALAEENAAIRRNIARAAAHGAIEIDHERTRARLSRLSGDRPSSWIVSGDPVWGARASGEDESASHASHASPGDDVSRRDATGAASGHTTDDPDAPPERRFVRVAADRLDGLLDLVGELVVCRSRMLVRVDRMALLHGEDQARHDAVVGLVDAFATSTQFANLDGRHRRGARTATAHGFGTLELDHYEEIHVLSRRLEEAASDVAEVRRDLGGEMALLAEDADALGKIVEGLQGEITRARMLTLETLFTRLQLPIRDAAQRAHRDVEIVTTGEHVAIDKSISDALFGPLLHIVRNAVVHGIEAPAARAASGKPAAGTIRLAARQEHGQIILEISDDGAGVDAEALHRAGVARGALDPSVPVSDPRVLDLIFVDGVSTSPELGEVAGRGVGGSVVRRAIDRLNGSIQVLTERGTGTTFRIALPISISITQAVLFRAAGTLVAIPIAFTEMIRRRDEVEVSDSFGRLRMNLDGKMVPIHPIAALFGPPAPPPPDAAVIVCVVGGERVAIQADAIVGQEEVVVKSLGALLDGHPLFSGCTLRGDNELALILDVPGVLAASQPARRPAASALPAGGEPDAAAPVSPVPPTVTAPAQAPVSPPARVGRRRVLFVDDSLSVRKVAERMLGGLDVEVVTAVDGQDALDKLRALSFALVFTDLEMPRLHGYDLIREMQYLPAYRAIPVVVVSSRSGQKHIERALAMGAREYLTKPFSADLLRGVLDRLARTGGEPS